MSAAGAATGPQPSRIGGAADTAPRRDQHGITMIHPTGNQTAAHRSVRGGQGAPIVCSACGCRLDAADNGRFVHFGRFGGRDARGCRIDCAEREHDVLGRPLGD